MSNPVVFDFEEALAASDTVVDGGEVKPDASTQDQPKTQDQGAQAQSGSSTQDDPRVAALTEALRISESARMNLANQFHGGQQQQQPQQPKWYSREELRDMLASDDPDQRVLALEISNQQAIAVAAHQLEQRLGPLANGALHSAKAEAKRRFPVEFELFGDQIEQYAANLPDKGPLATEDGWNHLVRFVRGDPANAEKYYDKVREAKARSEQLDLVPPSFPQTRQPARTSAASIDDDTRRVAQGLIDAGIYKNLDEYVRDMQGYTNYFNG